MKTIKSIFFDFRSCLLVISIVTFAGVSSAQHVKVIDGTRLAAATQSGRATTSQIYRNVNGTWTVLSTTAGDVQSVRAGQTIRLRIASANNRGKLIVGVDDAKVAVDSRGGTLYLATDAGVYQVPCEGPATRIGVDSGSQLTISGTVSDPIMNWETDPAWKGTCRMISVKLRDGTEVRGRVRFE